MLIFSPDLQCGVCLQVLTSTAMSLSSYDELLKQVASLKVENTHLRRELQDNSSHLTKLENEASTMKDVFSHLDSAMQDDAESNLTLELAYQGQTLEVAYQCQTLEVTYQSQKTEVAYQAQTMVIENGRDLDQNSNSSNGEWFHDVSDAFLFNARNFVCSCDQDVHSVACLSSSSSLESPV